MDYSDAPLRDRVAHRLANAALLIATPQYRKWIKGSIRYGLAAALRDSQEGRPPPGPSKGWDIPLVQKRQGTSTEQ